MKVFKLLLGSLLACATLTAAETIQKEPLIGEPPPSSLSISSRNLHEDGNQSSSPLGAQPSEGAGAIREEERNIATGDHSKSLYLTIQEMPKKSFYHRELFQVTYKLRILQEYDEIRTLFWDENEIKSVSVLNPDSPWIKEEDGTLSNLFYYKIRQSHFTLPTLTIQALKDNQPIAEESLKGEEGKAIELGGNPLFSKVVATNLAVTEKKVTSYDTENNLVVFRVEAEGTDLGDFSIPQHPKQGIESSNITLPKASMIYYVIMPKSEPSLIFDYFNLEKYQYERITLENLAVDERVSTQADIKPKNTLQIFLFSILGVLIVLLALLYVYYRNPLLIIVALLLLGYSTYLALFKHEGYLQAGSQVSILPTRNSTIIFQATTPMKVEILSERDDYYKIILADEKIGWVKKSEIRKD